MKGYLAIFFLQVFFLLSSFAQECNPACQNGGACSETQPGVFECDCLGTGFEGATCEDVPEGCDPFFFPCQNGGDCYGGVCDCFFTNFHGPFCEIPNLVCSPNPCENGGVCDITGCTCSGGFTGDFCNIAPGSCNSNGFETATGCACHSGFTGTECEIDGSSPCSPLPTVPPMETEIVAEFMSSLSQISANHFTFVVESPARDKRYFRSISLNGHVNCTYPGPNAWKEFRDDTCRDAYYGNFSIGQVVGCGFTEDQQGGVLFLDGTVQVSAIDSLAELRGHQVTRTTNSILHVSLRLPTFVNLTTSSLTVFSPINTMAAITFQDYNPTTDVATVKMTTSVQWPYLLATPSVDVPATLSSASPVALVSDVNCPSNDPQADCFQETTVTIEDVSTLGCSLDGEFSLHWNAGCRSGQTPCPLPATSPVDITFNILTGNLCGSVQIETSLTGNLKSFQDNTYQNERMVYLANERLHLKASLTSDVTIESITIHEIRVIVPSQAKTLTIAADELAIPPYTDTLSMIFHENDEATNEATFSFLAVAGPGAGALFDITGDGAIVFQVEADLEVSYRTTFGRKRDVERAGFSLSSTFVLDATKKN